MSEKLASHEAQASTRAILYQLWVLEFLQFYNLAQLVTFGKTGQPMILRK